MEGETSGTRTERVSKRGRKRTVSTPAKLKRKQENEKRRRAQLVNLGREAERWKRLVRELNSTHEKLAKLLLDSYYRHLRLTSTPSQAMAIQGPSLPLKLSDIEKSGSDVPLSGVELIAGSSSSELETTAQKDWKKAMAIPGPSVPLKLSGIVESGSDVALSEVEALASSSGTDLEPIAKKSWKKPLKRTRPEETFDPSNVSINLTFDDKDFEEPEVDDEDHTWYTDISIEHNRLTEVEALPTITGDEDVIPPHEEENVFVPTEGSRLFSKISDPDDIIGESCFLTYESSVRLLLAGLLPPCICSKKYVLSFQKSGTAMYVKWVCEDGHEGGHWCSQPKLNFGMLAGDFFWSTSVLYSGNNYRKMRMMADIMSCGWVSESTHYAIQKDYAIPAVESYYLSMQEGILDGARDRRVIIAGDGRMDSPGHSALYCTYIVTDYDTGDILTVEVINKKMTALNSNAMEKEGLLRALAFLKEKGINVVEAVTDAHVSIAAHFRKNEPAIKHSWDIWHGAKNLGKKIIAAGNKKATRDLVMWSKDICSHFWDCAKTCEQNHGKFLSKWRGLYHHVQNEHEWLSGDGYGEARCGHDPIPQDEERNKPWLKPCSQVLQTLGGIVLNKRFQNNISYYVNNRHTGTIENINSHILMYCSKRNSYQAPAYRARNYLALIDYQNHKDRAPAVNEDGSIRYCKQYSKHAKSWVVKPQMQKKNYQYVKELQENALSLRLKTTTPLSTRVQLETWDPRNIAPNIAPVPAPSTAELVRTKKTRFQ